MAVVQVLKSRDGGDVPTWRVELHDDGWCRLDYCGGPIFRRASVEQVGRYLAEAGVDIERDLVKG